MNPSLPDPSTLPCAYISGPMTGLPDFNREAFHTEAARLRTLGYRVENPAESSGGGSWQGYMRMALIQMARSDWLYMLPGWEQSRGAKIEHRLALDIGLEVAYADGAERPTDRLEGEG